MKALEGASFQPSLRDINPLQFFLKVIVKYRSVVHPVLSKLDLGIQN